MKKLIVCILAVLMMVPVLAFAEDSHQIPEINLVTGDHSGKTLERDGYAWDEANAVLTLKDISVGSDITLPKRDCTINVQGKCYVGMIWRNDSGAAQSTTINGTDGAELWAEIDVSGALTLNRLTMTEGEIRNASVGLNYALTMTDSDITIQGLSWMTDAGIDLKNSKLYVQVPMDELGQCWTEMIAMDNKSEIESDRPLSNYGRRDLADFGDVLNYVAEPEGGRFYQEPGEAITIVTEVEGELAKADHFILRAPASSGGEDDGPKGGNEDGGPKGGEAPGTDKETQAPATGDGGIMLFAAAAAAAAGGAVVLLRKKKEN